MLMGFMPLKEAVNTETSLATPSLYKLTREVRQLCISLSLSLYKLTREVRHWQAIMHISLSLTD